MSYDAEIRIAGVMLTKIVYLDRVKKNYLLYVVFYNLHKVSDLTIASFSVRHLAVG